MRKTYSLLMLPTYVMCEEILSESSKSAPKVVLYEGIELVKKVFDVLFLTDGRKPIPILMLPTNLLCEEIRVEISKCVPKVVFYEGIELVQKVFGQI